MKSQVVAIILGAVSCLVVHLAPASASDGKDDESGKAAIAANGKTETTTKAESARPAAAKLDAPAPLADRERWLLERVELLEKRVEELEAKSHASPAQPAAHGAEQEAAAKLTTAHPDTTSATASSSSGSGTDMPSNVAQPESATTVAADRAATSAQPNPAAVESSSAHRVVPGEMTPPLAVTKANAGTLSAQADSTKQQPAQPFAFADFTWLNGNARTKDLVWDSKYFTPEFRIDAHYMKDYNQPKDHSMGGSTESFRSGEVQLEQLSFGGDLHVGNVRGRVLTMFGLFATTTPRNDGSAGVGQWNLNDAYRYFSEAYGGYHFNVNHGLNIDAGIFVSYIGLFSYYNFDNWAYQPSYVSSNTPWFFNGLRVQWFPTEKLKIEPWFINGWQSYAKFNGRPGLGGQILYRPTGWLSVVSNNYGMGTDTLGNPGRSRIHTDDSIEVKYYDNPERTLDKMAFSLTGDLGCEYGGGVSCYHNTKNGPKQSFAGWMLYNRMWFHNDKFGLTIGGGKMDNPGRYLTLLPPINGATAVSGSPYFPGNPGSVYKAYDGTVTFDWMPSQYITFRFENGYRHANVPYWTGRQGITPPGGNVAPIANNGVVGTGASYICTNGSSSAVSGFAPSGNGFTADNAGGAVTGSCATQYGGGWFAWQPDLRRGQAVSTIAILVKF